MSENLGKMEKPEAGQFKKGRKLFFVPLMFSPPPNEIEPVALVGRYWQEVASQVQNLEASLSGVKRVFHELISSGEEATKTLENLRLGSQAVVKTLLEAGATLEIVEEAGMLTEFMDWSRCLSIGLDSPAVWSKVYEAYLDAWSRRNEHIAKRLDETLLDDEVGVLFFRENHQLQFPADMQVFYIAPPSLDAIHRWLRERQEKSRGKAEEKPKEETKEEPPEGGR